MLLLHKDAEEQQFFYYNPNVSSFGLGFAASLVNEQNKERSLKKTNLAKEHAYSMAVGQTERGPH